MSSIIRVEKNANYVVMNKSSLVDSRLSWKAKGLHAFMLSKPDDWKFFDTELVNHATDGIDSLKSALKELKSCGYMMRTRKQNGVGRFDWETVVYEVPYTEKPSMDKPCMVKPSMDEPCMDEPSMDNPYLLSTDVLSTDSLSIEELSIDKLKDIVDPVRNLYDHYLSKNIIQHSKITGPMKTAANARLKDYTYEQLVQAIDNYAAVYSSNDYWFSTKYGFADLMRDKDIRKFIDDAEPFRNFGNRGGRNEVDRRSIPRNDEDQARIDATNERRKRIAGI